MIRMLMGRSGRVFADPLSTQPLIGVAAEYSSNPVLVEGHAKSDADIRELMSGNICRCGAYPNIVAAVRDVLEGKKDAAV